MRERSVDIAIVGAGPAGLAAADAAMAHGASVALLDDNPLAGGQVWRGGRVAPAFAALAQTGSAHYLPGTRVVATPVAGQLLLEDASGAHHLYYRKLIVASGARERLLPFPGWTLPGVTGAGGLQALVKNGMDVRGQRVVLAGTGPLLLAAAASLRAAGADVLLVAEQTDWARLARFAKGLWRQPAKLAQAIALGWELRGTPYRAASYVVAAQGTGRLQQVRMQLAGREVVLDCDWLGVGYGLLPNTELLAALGCTLVNGAAVVDRTQQTSQPHIYAAGEATGIGGLDKALLEGRIAGLAASGQHAAAAALAAQRARHLHFVAELAHCFSLRPEIAQLAQADTLVCRCEDVSLSRLQQYGSWREAKLQTRCGMGPCQGRICGAACQTLLGWSDIGQRPPIQPARLATLALSPAPLSTEALP
ncbi:MAG: NAD(P)/FAD-dependent oxidoreductase [Burkholderiales bacterium]|nr:NAD(P)/FAD-dependent oxidoreductase [Burkholderiales bacterium]